MIAFFILILLLPVLIAVGSYLIFQGMRWRSIRKWRYLSGMAMLCAGMSLLFISTGGIAISRLGIVMANARLIGVGLPHLLILAGILLLCMSRFSHKLSDKEFYYPY